MDELDQFIAERKSKLLPLDRALVNYTGADYSKINQYKNVIVRNDDNRIIATFKNMDDAKTCLNDRRLGALSITEDSYYYTIKVTN